MDFEWLVVSVWKTAFWKSMRSFVSFGLDRVELEVGFQARVDEFCFCDKYSAF